MCKCIATFETGLRDEFEKKNPAIEDLVLPALTPKAILIGHKNDLQMMATAEATYQVGNKNKKWKKNIAFKFCPFCGVKY